MTSAKLIIVAALVATIVLFLRRREGFALAALVAAAIETVLVFGVIHLHVAGLNLMLILGAVLGAGAVGAWLRTGEKVAVTAATLAATIGIMQVLTALV